MNKQTSILFYLKIIEQEGNCYPSTRLTFFKLTAPDSCRICPFLNERGSCPEEDNIILAKQLLKQISSTELFEVVL